MGSRGMVSRSMLFKNAVIPVPPVQELETICRWIVNHLQPIASSMDRAQKEVDLIREFRTHLSSEIVTGKPDVRGVELPKVEEVGGAGRLG